LEGRGYRCGINKRKEEIGREVASGQTNEINGNGIREKGG
jgi:hypothetical protein